VALLCHSGLPLLFFCSRCRFPPDTFIHERGFLWFGFLEVIHPCPLFPEVIFPFGFQSAFFLRVRLRVKRDPSVLPTSLYFCHTIFVVKVLLHFSLRFSLCGLYVLIRNGKAFGRIRAFYFSRTDPLVRFVLLCFFLPPLFWETFSCYLRRSSSSRVESRVGFSPSHVHPS